MKIIKTLFLLIILGLLGTLIYQNLEYFMTTVALNLDLKFNSWAWTVPELQNIAYFGICFLLGLFLAGGKGLLSKFKLKKQIKIKDAAIASLNDQVNTLKTKLEVFQHDPYIKKDIEEKQKIEPPESEKTDLPVQPEDEEGVKSNTTD
ncbi:MAG: hypothetical protein GY699_21040 [Desulfobacteraceae bacterium]|nr:hypothetical protein [Desulfobacteraceae bacterium]